VCGALSALDCERYLGGGREPAKITSAAAAVRWPSLSATATMLVAPICSSS
jgi:hypothetical protein